MVREIIMKEIIGVEIIERAMKKGCDTAEVYMKSAQGISVEAKEGKVEALEASRDFGISLKVTRNSKLGFAFTTNHEAIDKMTDDAIEGAAWTAMDEFVGIPEHAPPDEVSIYDKCIDELNEDDIIRNAIYLEECALDFDTRIKKVRKAEVAAGSGSTTIVNSNGINITYKSSYYSGHVTTLAEDGSGDSQMGWDYASSRRMSDVDIQSIGRGASKRAIELLDSRKITAVKVPVILSPAVAVEFLDILSASLSAEAVQKQRSFLSGKVGQNIVSGLVNVIDDGTMAWGIGTRPVDDEGVPARSKILISKGSLTGYIYNTYAAKKDGVASTGNAARGGFKTLPGIGVTNIYIDTPASGSNGSLLKNLPKGIVVLGAMGVHTANPVSGDFSVGISGLWIENGEAAYPVKEAVMSGNILDLFRKVEAVGTDLKFYGNSGSPSILIGDMDISA